MSAPASTRSPSTHDEAVTTATPNWASLSPRGRAILQCIAIRIWCGYSPSEVARSLGVSTRAVNACLDELRDELEQAGLADE